MSKSLAHIIEQTAKQRGMNPYALCAEIGLNGGNYSNWSRGICNASPRMTAKALGGLEGTKIQQAVGFTLKPVSSDELTKEEKRILTWAIVGLNISEDLKESILTKLDL